jgi:hypothetical protein
MRLFTNGTEIPYRYLLTKMWSPTISVGTIDSLGILNASTQKSRRTIAIRMATPIDSKYSRATLLRANARCRALFSSSLRTHAEIRSSSRSATAFSSASSAVPSSVRPWPEMRWDFLCTSLRTRSTSFCAARTCRSRL